MSIQIEVKGVPALKQALEKLGGREANNRLRRALRAGIKVIREEMRSEASTRSDLPRRFRKTRTRAHRTPLGVSVAPLSPLSTIFEHGARAHSIGSGTHPGMKARPFVAPVFAKAEDRATDAFKEEVFRGL